MNSNIDKKYLKSLSKNQLIRFFLERDNLQSTRINQLETLVQSLQLEIQALKKDSSNSSKPPSSDMSKVKKNQSLREKSNKKSGGQNGHKGNCREQTDNPDIIIACSPQTCNGCGYDLSNIAGITTSKRQEADIPPIKLEVTEYRQQSVICPHCQKTNLGQYPEYISGPMQFGINIKSFITYLNIKHKIPYERLTEIFLDMLNVQISQGSIENTLECFKEKCQPYYQNILSIIKTGKWIGSDETGVHVNGKKWWLWIWQNTLGNYYAVSNSRGMKTVKEYFKQDYWGILIHDCWSAQLNTIARLGHQLCHPHLIRDLNYLIETFNSSWCYKMKCLLLASEKARDKIWKNSFNEQLRNQIIVDYQKQLAVFINAPLSKTKEIATMQKRFRKHQDKVLYFMQFTDVPFHNNSSEQAIRNAKIHQKISGGFRSEAGAKRHAVILSIIETCKKQNLNVFDSLKQIYLVSVE